MGVELGGCPAQQQNPEQEGALAQNTPKSICYSMAGLNLKVSDTQHTESAREMLPVVYLQCN